MPTNKGLDETGVAQFASDIKMLADETYPANATVCLPYDSSSTYALGDYCLHTGLLYKCTTAITTGEGWTASHWTQVDIATELKSASKAVFQNVIVQQSAFYLNGTYEEYNYRAAIRLAGVTENVIPEVVFDVSDVQESIFAPIAQSYSGGVYIYANDLPYATLKADIDVAVFLEEVSGSGVMRFTYTNAWSTDPGSYGITLNGTPNNGDVIEVTYNADESAALMDIYGSIVIPTIICWNCTAVTSGSGDGSNDIYGIPSGGDAGQVLSKASGTDYDVEWTDIGGVQVMYLEAVIPSDHVDISAVVPTGATFIGWLTPVPVNWGGALWYSSIYSETSLWTNVSGSNKSVVCPYLVKY